VASYIRLVAYASFFWCHGDLLIHKFYYSSIDSTFSTLIHNSSKFKLQFQYSIFYISILHNDSNIIQATTSIIYISILHNDSNIKQHIFQRFRSACPDVSCICKLFFFLRNRNCIFAVRPVWLCTLDDLPFVLAISLPRLIAEFHTESPICLILCPGACHRTSISVKYSSIV
jgi:hypothetical protein